MTTLDGGGPPGADDDDGALDEGDISVVLDDDDDDDAAPRQVVVPDEWHDRPPPSYPEEAKEEAAAAPPPPPPIDDEGVEEEEEADDDSSMGGGEIVFATGVESSEEGDDDAAFLRQKALLMNADEDDGVTRSEQREGEHREIEFPTSSGSPYHPRSSKPAWVPPLVPPTSDDDDDDEQDGGGVVDDDEAGDELTALASTRPTSPTSPMMSAESRNRLRRNMMVARQNSSRNGSLIRSNSSLSTPQSVGGAGVLKAWATQMERALQREDRERAAELRLKRNRKRDKLRAFVGIKRPTRAFLKKKQDDDEEEGGDLKANRQSWSSVRAFFAKKKQQQQQKGKLRVSSGGGSSEKKGLDDDDDDHNDEEAAELRKRRSKWGSLMRKPSLDDRRLAAKTALVQKVVELQLEEVRSCIEEAQKRSVNKQCVRQLLDYEDHLVSRWGFHRDPAVFEARVAAELNSELELAGFASEIIKILDQSHPMYLEYAEAELLEAMRLGRMRRDERALYETHAIQEYSIDYEGPTVPPKTRNYLLACFVYAALHAFFVYYLVTFASVAGRKKSLFWLANFGSLLGLYYLVTSVAVIAFFHGYVPLLIKEPLQQYEDPLKLVTTGNFPYSLKAPSAATFLVEVHPELMQTPTARAIFGHRTRPFACASTLDAHRLSQVNAALGIPGRRRSEHVVVSPRRLRLASANAVLRQELVVEAAPDEPPRVALLFVFYLTLLPEFYREFLIEEGFGLLPFVIAKMSFLPSGSYLDHEAVEVVFILGLTILFLGGLFLAVKIARHCSEYIFHSPKVRAARSFGGSSRSVMG